MLPSAVYTVIFTCVSLYMNVANNSKNGKAILNYCKQYKSQSASDSTIGNTLNVHVLSYLCMYHM